MIEREILGCLLQDNSLILETVIRPNYFEQQEHQLLFQSMLKLAHEDKAVDKVTLLSENYEYISQLGGPSFITGLESLGKVENFETYQRKLVDNYRQRQSKTLAKDYANGEQDISDLMHELEELNSLGIEEERGVDDLLDEMYELPYVKQTETGIKSGLSDLDSILGGFNGANSYILGARPSIGKSATMLKFALEAMKRDVVPVIFSLEMSKESLLRRLISTVGQINLFIANNPYELTSEQKKTWQKAINTLKKYEFEIYDQPAQTVEFIRAKTRQAKQEHGKRILVLIDYLTLIHSDKKYQSEHLKVGAISKQLKEIAKSYDCPVVTLAQLSRVVEQRNDKRPMLSDLRESGSIEEDADGVMFLYRDSYYNADAENDNMEIIVAKHRNGPTGTATIYYNKATGKMGDFDGRNYA